MKSLVILNNMPAFYRDAPFRELVAGFERRTGGRAEVVYQVRRDYGSRAEWFYTPDADLTGQVSFIHDQAPSRRRMMVTPRSYGLAMLRRTRPTHIFASGWDSPACQAAIALSRVTSARLALWVESNRSTSRHQGRAATAFRRACVRAASTIVVPTSASAAYVEDLGAAPSNVVRLRNPVTLTRLADDVTGSTTRRVVFLGDLSLRKGFDRFGRLAAAARQRPSEDPAIEFLAWGRDTEGIQASYPHVTVRGQARQQEIVAQLRPDDIVYIGSRVDPAPLVFSEALALGLRVIVSRDIAYSDDAAQVRGACAVDCDDASAVLTACERLWNNARPDPVEGTTVNPSYFAESTLASLLAGTGSK